jgi:glycerophosphoryl diester phosphodiesterase
MRPLAVAHRGYSAKWPENTVAGCRAAIAAGADLVEADVRLSAEGTLFCFHDPDLARLSGDPAAVAECMDARLRALRYGGEAPAEFSQIVAEVRGRAGLLVDVKLDGQAVLEALERVLAAAGWPENVWLGLRSAAQAELARKRFGERASVVALMREVADAEAFLAADARALRLWERQLDGDEARFLRDRAQIWVTAHGAPSHKVGDTDGAGLRKIVAFGPQAVLLNDPLLLAAEGA